VLERYLVTNGIRMFAVEEGDGPVVLLVHGFPEHWWSWRFQLPALAAAGYRAVAVDLPGYGRSDKPDVDYVEPWINRCLVGVVDALRAGRVVIAGHDWGGMLVWPFARRYPDRLAGVVGVNTADSPRPPMPIPDLLAQLSPDRPPYVVQYQARGPAEWFHARDPHAFIADIFLGPATKRTEVFTPEVIDRYVEPFRPVGSITPAIEYYRGMAADWEAAAQLPEIIDVPALMISAADDPVLTPAMADGMEARVPKLTKVVIEDCGHWTQQEQPGATNHALISWLDTLPRWS
jgi:pimeloyl-ACP methyl ester carboxylesterase